MIGKVARVTPESELAQHHAEAVKICEEVGVAIEQRELGKIVTKLEELILHYYKDVRAQAQKSFNTARSAAQFGFYVLVATLAYVLIFDALGHFGYGNHDTGNSMTVGQIGIVSGAMIEFIAAVAFWLYSRGARQFGAFHICLERTHRYLLAYEIAEQMKDNKDATLHELVCNMANAPMITHRDIDSQYPDRLGRLNRPVS